MSRPLKVHELLDAKDLEALESFCRERRRTIDKIEVWIAAAGYKISRGAVWAWRRNFVTEDRYRASGEVAKNLIEAAKGKDAVTLSDAASIQIGQMIFEASLQCQDAKKIETKDVVALSAALKNIITGKRHLETLKEETAERQKLAVAEAEKTVKSGGSAEDAIKKMREVLGIEESKAA